MHRKSPDLSVADNFHYFAVAHFKDSVAVISKGFIMSDNDERLVQFASQIEEKFVQFFLVLGIKATRRLISKNNRWLIHQSPCYSHSLLLAARQLRRLMIEPA